MKCPICDTVSFYKWGTVNNYSILRCKSCGIGITSPFPEPEELKLTNSEIYKVDQRIQMYLSRQDYFEKRYEKNIQLIRDFGKQGKLLDIGCSIGLFLKVARQHGFETVGVELNKECAEYGRTQFGLDIYSELVEDIGFSDKSFDIITLFDVLEHLPNLEQFLGEIRRILKDDGLLVVQCPNLESLMAKLTGSQWNWLTPPDHLYHFTPKAISKLLGSNGFNINKVKTWEPAEEFYNNVIAVYRQDGLLAKVMIKILCLTRAPLLLIKVVQKIWWRKLYGGLIEVYASKSKEAK